MSETTAQLNSSSPEEPVRVALLVEYCGSGFHGSQFQPGLPTVQSAMEAALASLNLKTSAVSFAGRTDAGVHARGQVAHFDVTAGALERLPNPVKSLNAMLPPTVAVRRVHPDAGMDFNSRREALAKWYRYVIHNSPERSAWAGLDAATVLKPLDAELMNQAAGLLLGTHNFESFKCPDTAVTDNVCTVYHSQVQRDGERIVFDIVADRFLYKMVRNLTGQLMAIGQAGLKPEVIREVMNRRDRKAAATTAPAEGLTMMAVRYREPHNFFHTDQYVQTLTTLMESMHNENLFRKAS